MRDLGRKTRLVREYEEATAAFSEAVKELRRRMGTSPKEDYKHLQRIANEARLKSGQTRFSLEQHIDTPTGGQLLRGSG
jgi:hypothetical protein